MRGNIDHNRKALSMWNGWSRSRHGKPAYDLWLDDYKKDLDRYKYTKFLDLGCGTGADTLYLIERGYKVISADYSKESINNINLNIPGGEGIILDMNERFCFDDNSFCIIIADICLHYFNEVKTIHVMNEIKRILKKDGLLIARVSSINDKYYGSGSGYEIEKRYYDHGSYAQRYFNEEDLYKFFGIIGDLTFIEKPMTRKEAYYSMPKYLYQVRVVCNK